jgi:hypothetical protein
MLLMFGFGTAGKISGSGQFVRISNNLCSDLGRVGGPGVVVQSGSESLGVQLSYCRCIPATPPAHAQLCRFLVHLVISDIVRNSTKQLATAT